MPFMLNAVPMNTSPTCAGSNLLTKRKYCQPSLLRVVGERTMATRMTRADASKSSTHSRLPEIKPHDDRKDKIQVEMEIYAQPVSSDEEEGKPTIPSPASPASERTARKPKFSPPRPVISLSTSSVKHEGFAAVPDLDDLLFPSSQPKKKRKIGYTARNIHLAKDEVKVEPEVKFAAPAALPVEEKPSPQTEFKAPRAINELARRSSRNASKKAPFQKPLTDPLIESTRTGPKFKMPTVLDDPDSSAPSLADSIFDVPEASQEKPRGRSGSTSSLSSHSSIDMQLSLAEQQALAHDDTGDGLDGKEWDRCDICHSRVERSVFRELTAKYKGKGIRRRQRICAAHKQREVQRTWLEKGYPIIDWQRLEAERIPKHMPHLTKILRRKAPSFYRTKLDGVARDGRKALYDYLKEGVIYVVKQGYYGPRGARVMGHAITTTMETELTAQLKLDKVVRAAGCGGYVSAVLVPELMIELVKEDMRVTTSEEARHIMEQSTEDGALLNGDDDEVVLRTERDDL